MPIGQDTDLRSIVLVQKDRFILRKWSFEKHCQHLMIFVLNNEAMNKAALQTKISDLIWYDI